MTLTSTVDAARLTEVLDSFDDLAERPVRVDVDAEHLSELPADEDDRDAVDVADEDGAGEVVGEPAEAHDPGEEETGADEQGQCRRQLRRLVAPGGGEWQDRGGDERRDRPLGTDDQLPGRAEKGVEDGRQEEGVEPVHGRQPCDPAYPIADGIASAATVTPASRSRRPVFGLYSGMCALTGTTRSCSGSCARARNGDRPRR